MDSEDKFKELLKKKLGEKEFDFNPANWEKAQKMIDASHEKRNRRLPFILLGLLFLVIGIIFFYPGKTAKTGALADAKKGSNPNAGTAETLKPGAIERKKQSTPNAALKTPHPGDAAVARVNTPIQKQEKIASKSTHIAEAQAPKNPANQATQKDYDFAAARGKYKGRAEINIIRLQTSSSEVSQGATAGSTNGTGTGKIGLQVSPSEKTGEKTPLKQDDGATTPAAFAETKQPAIADPLNEKATQETLPITAVEPKDTSAAVMPAIIAATAAAKKDSLPPATTASVAAVSPEAKMPPRYIISIEAGANYLAGWKTQGKRDAQGFNPVIGINYMNFVTPKIRISAGIHYTSVGNLSQYSNTSTLSHYGLGEESAVTKITPVKIQYLAAPLKINYVIDPKTMIGAGYTLGYLLTVNSKMETYTEREDFSSAPKNSKTTGYTQGFSRFDSQLSVFYRRQLYRDLYANAEFLFGIQDIKNNAFFVSNTFERNMGLKLTLVYNIFKK